MGVFQIGGTRPVSRRYAESGEASADASSISPQKQIRRFAQDDRLMVCQGLKSGSVYLGPPNWEAAQLHLNLLRKSSSTP